MNDRYESPLNSRYASRAMQALFSADKKFRTWRRLWLALAETERDLGLPITAEQIAELRDHLDDIDLEAAAREERQVRHDVMAHIHVYASQCPQAAGIIHLGATSCYVGDNTDLIVMAEALRLVRSRLVVVVGRLAGFARQYRDLPTLGFTHFQPAQPVTVGKRATLWLQDLLLDIADLDFVLGSLTFLGSKGTTGTQASFLALFGGDHAKVRELDRRIAERMGFAAVCPVAGQTYSRKHDSRILNILSGVAQSAHKFSNDIRLLQHLKEIEEPFEADQIGSSAMAYKRNPMRSERMAALARFVLATAQNPAMTAAGQWFERTLDDSANKRLAVPEAFLAVDAILLLYANITSGLLVYPRVIARHLEEELPFMATENILMAAVKQGGNRQDLHEKLRQHSMAAGQRVKVEGCSNDLLQRIAADPAFGLDETGLAQLLDPALYIGRSAEQVDVFLAEVVDPFLADNPPHALTAEIYV
jgi:adenylosuccinate lyase